MNAGGFANTGCAAGKFRLAKACQFPNFTRQLF